MAEPSRKNTTPTREVGVPRDFIKLWDMKGSSLARTLKYFGDEQFVIFGYCQAGGEVLWVDRQSSGFAPGAWRLFLHELAPRAAREGIDLGSLETVGTHVLVVDRMNDVVHAAPRRRATEHLANVAALSPPDRRCLCAVGESHRIAKRDSG